MVEPDVFVAAMSDHWQRTLKNVASPALQAVWHQLASTFNRQIATHGTAEGERWKVIQPETGTGKSQGLAVYCSLLSDPSHPGVLIVTRLKAQADEIAATVNRLTGDDTAVAYHGDNKLPVGTLSKFPVLVITHRAYEIGLDAINRGVPTATNWSAYHAWRDGQRKLVVIDEALDIIEEAQIDLEKVRVVRAVIPFEVAERFPAQMKAIATLEEVLTQVARIANARKGTGVTEPERILWAGSAKLPEVADMTELRRELRAVRLDLKLTHRDDLKDNRKLTGKFDTILRDIQATLENWNWYAKKLSTHTMNTARLIVPDDITGAVILDATASSNLIYQLFDARVDVVPVPANARSYSNVQLHVSFGHAVGKTSMVKNAKVEAPRLIDNLRSAIGPHRKVFVCCHQWVEPHLVGYRHGFDAFEVGHWNAVDGRNDWSEFDTAVIFGLPYRDKTWSANTFMALRGLQNNEWLNSEGDRPFRQYRDVRHSLEVGQLVVSIVQAINRVRCRRVIDTNGNCPATDVFLLLPNDKIGKELLAGIEREMPGVNVVDWQYTEVKRKTRKSDHEEALVRYATLMRQGRKSVTDVTRELGMSRKTFVRMADKIRDASCQLYLRLIEAGVRYEVERDGSTQRGYLVKT